MSETDTTTPTPDEVAKKGEEIYNSKLKAILEPTQNGRFVAIDVETADYFLGDTILQALEEAQKKYPTKLFHTIKVGFQGVFKMGGYARNFAYDWKT
jgi:hypothetical protein